MRGRRREDRAEISHHVEFGWRGGGGRADGWMEDLSVLCLAAPSALLFNGDSLSDSCCAGTLFVSSRSR